ncbi:MAG: hypothetical protein M3Q65_23895, partial [Chloroflexota bacterium]|nr:hypothetical protein [Chloroflexota bacterium]
RLWGAAEALREVAGAAMVPGDRRAYDRDLAATRRLVDGDAWAAAWAQGRGMTLERTAEDALADPEAAT